MCIIGGQLKDGDWEALKSICYPVKIEKHYWWVSPSGLWEDVKKTQAPGTLHLINQEAWLSVKEGVHLYEEYILNLTATFVDNIAES